MDEAKVERHGRLVYVSVCLDLERRGVSSLCCRSISSPSTINVVRQALQSCRNSQLVITDRAPWYEYAFRYLELNYVQRTFGIRGHQEMVPHFSSREQRDFTIISPSKIHQELSRE